MLSNTGTNIISWLGFITGTLGLIISAVVAWFKAIRPAKIIGILSGIEFPRWSSIGNDSYGDKIINPMFFLKNIGVRDAIIELIKLRFCFGNITYDARLFGRNQEKEQGHFIGMVLSPNGAWENDCAFALNRAQYEKLADSKGTVEVEVKLIGEKWMSIKMNKFTFDIQKDDLFPSKINNKNFTHFVWSDTISSQHKKQ